MTKVIHCFLLQKPKFKLSIKKMQKSLYDILAAHTGQDYETIEKDCERDNWMSGEEAKTYGLIDEVLSRKA